MIAHRTAIIGVRDGAIGYRPQVQVRMSQLDTLIKHRNYHIGVTLAQRPGTRRVDPLKSPLIRKECVIGNNRSSGRRAR